jgi:UDP-N-acetylglucosamine 2-epimerase (non-hydrolysing)
MAPLGFLDYAKLQMESFCVVSDSGSITEESSILGFPAVTMRQAHERPEGMDEGTLVMCDMSAERVRAAVRVVTQQVFGEAARFRAPPDYEPGNVSTKVLRIILSYVDYVRRTVWFEPEVSS